MKCFEIHLPRNGSCWRCFQSGNQYNLFDCIFLPRHSHKTSAFIFVSFFFVKNLKNSPPYTGTMISLRFLLTEPCFSSAACSQYCLPHAGYHAARTSPKGRGPDRSPMSRGSCEGTVSLKIEA
jgi:hypothetical protein